MIYLQLSKKTEDRLTKLSTLLGRPKSVIVKQAISKYMEGREKRLQGKSSPRKTHPEKMRSLVRK